MPREHFHKPVRDGSGVLRQNVTVRLLEPGVETLIAEPIYVASTGTETYENPRVVEDGVLDFYLDRPRIVDIGITPEGTTAETILRNQWVGDEEAYKETYSFTLAGMASAQTSNLRFYIEEDCTIEKVRVSAGIAPVGQDLVVDLNRNGATVFSTQANRPRVVAGQNTGTAVPDVTALVAGDYLSIDIDQVGSTTPGSDLVVQVRVRRV